MKKIIGFVFLVFVAGFTTFYEMLPPWVLYLGITFFAIAAYTAWRARRGGPPLMAILFVLAAGIAASTPLTAQTPPKPLTFTDSATLLASGPGNWSSQPEGWYHIPPSWEISIEGHRDEVYQTDADTCDFVQLLLAKSDVLYRTLWWNTTGMTEEEIVFWESEGWIREQGNDWNLCSGIVYLTWTNVETIPADEPPTMYTLYMPLIRHDEAPPPPPTPECTQQIRVTYLDHSEVINFQPWPGTMRTLGLFAAGTTLTFEMVEGEATQSNLSWPSWYALQGSGPEWVFQPTSTEVPPHPGLGIPYEFHVWNSAPGQPYCLASFQMQWDP